MTTKTLNLKFNNRQLNKGSDQSREKLEKLDDKAQELDKSFGQIAATTAKWAAGAGLAAGAITFKLAQSFTDAAVTSENYRVRLNALLGSQKEGNKAFELGSDLAAKLPFQYEEIMGSITQLSGVVKGGAEEVTSWVPMIADLATVSGLSIEETTGQVQRMLSAGANSADMFRERGILSMLGFEAGVKISAEETKKALIAAYEDPMSQFAGASEQMAQTWDGTMSMIGDKWFQIRQSVMDEGVFAYFKEIAQIINEGFGGALEDSEGKVRGWADAAISALSAIIETGGHVLDFFDIMANGVDVLHSGILLLAQGWTSYNQTVLEVERSVKSFFGASEATLAAYDAAIAEAAASYKEYGETIKQNNQDIIERSNRDWSEWAKGITARAEEAAKKVQESNDEMAKSSEELTEQQRAEMKAEEQRRARQIELAEKAKRQAAAEKKAQEEAKKAADERRKAEKKLAEEKKRVADSTAALLDQMDFERRSMKMTEIAIEKETRIRAAHKQGIYDQDEAISRHVEAMQAEQAELDRTEAALKQIQDEAQQFEKRWDTMVENIQTAWGDTIHNALWTDGLDSFDDFTDSVLDMFKKMISEMVAAWLASGITGMMSGQGFKGFNMQAFTGGGGGFNIGSLFGGGNGGNGALSAASNGLGGASGLYSGFNQFASGVQQGGTGGALSAASGLASMYRGGSAIMSLFSGGSAAAAGTAASSAIAAQTAAVTSNMIAASPVMQTIASANATLAATAGGAGAAGAGAGSAAAAGGGGGFFSGIGSMASNAWAAIPGWGQAAIAVVAVAAIARELLGGGARDYSEILQEDYLPDLLGNKNNADIALGANGGTGFANGNTAIFGANWGITGTGLTAQHLVDGGENGNGGFFTGAQSSLDGFEKALRAAGFNGLIDNEGGTLRVFDEEKTVADIMAVWESYKEGLDGAVAHNEVFETAIENDLLKPSNLFFEQFAIGMGQSAFEARDSILSIDEAFDQMVANGMSGQEALYQSISDHYGLSLEQAQLFVEKSGVSLDQWISNLKTASGESLSEMLDFNAKGVTAFESTVAATSNKTNHLFGGVVSSFTESMERMNGSASGNIASIADDFITLKDVALGQAQTIADRFGSTLSSTMEQTNGAIRGFERAIADQTRRLEQAQHAAAKEITKQVRRGAETQVGGR